MLGKLKESFSTIKRQEESLLPKSTLSSISDRKSLLSKSTLSSRSDRKKVYSPGKKSTLQVDTV